jgi:hypothetical protein
VGASQLRNDALLTLGAHPLAIALTTYFTGAITSIIIADRGNNYGTTAQKPW